MNHRDRIGLVGRNGSGKSTFLTLLANGAIQLKSGPGWCHNCNLRRPLVAVSRSKRP
ncbi:ATP-binding cassette domain-containing protein [Secundilactobacillus kimchicus]|uniref:ATP-binding cassette domain-containing protein n=1 Tax=Secundilactobacillus kimchicus TaxID=528209 RepID=UPI0034E4D5CA